MCDLSSSSAFPTVAVGDCGVLGVETQEQLTFVI